MDEHLAAILAAPDDDAPRLVYADWLTGRGDARGELIPIQCELVRVPPADPVRRVELAAREQTLLAKNAKTWQPPACLRSAAYPRGKGHPAVPDEFRFRRGLAEIAFTDAVTFVTGAAEIFAKNPLCRGVEIQGDPGGSFEALARQPDLARLDTLRIRDAKMKQDDVDALAASPHARNLRELAIEKLPGKTVSSLKPLGKLAGLRRVSLFGSATADAVEGISALPFLERLNLGALGTKKLNAPAGERLAAASFPSLRVLSLQGAGLGTGGTKALARAPWLGALHTIDLGWNDVGAGALEAILNAQCAVRLALDNANGKSVGQLIAASPRLGELAELSLRNVLLTDDAVAALARSPNLGKLVRLDLRNCGITDAGFELLLESTLPSLVAPVLSDSVPHRLKAPLKKRFPHVTIGP